MSRSRAVSPSAFLPRLARSPEPDQLLIDPLQELPRRTTVVALYRCSGELTEDRVVAALVAWSLHALQMLLSSFAFSIFVSCHVALPGSTLLLISYSAAAGLNSREAGHVFHFTLQPSSMRPCSQSLTMVAISSRKVAV